MFLLLSLGSEWTAWYPWQMYILKVCSEFQRLLAGEYVAVSLLSFIVTFCERNFGEFAHLLKYGLFVFNY